MATGFMPNFIALLLGLACALPALAAEVALIGVIGDKAVVIAVDGGEPKTLKLGQTWNGIRLIAVEKTHATVELEGRQRVLLLGQHYRNAQPASDGRQTATLSADPRGHFFADATINGQPMRFVVDTGASVVVLLAADATRMGIDWRKGRPAPMQTANGSTTGYLKLQSVRVGGIELQNVDGVVVEQGLGSFGLLGMSFLNRLEMRRDGEKMELIRRF
jgi:aspartyl protease family protein